MLKLKILVILMFGAFALTDGNVKRELENDEGGNEVAFAPSPSMTANMNAYIDLVMIQVGPWIMRSGLIPMELPDYVEIMEHRPILITYTGELHLTNGVLTRLVSVARSGNAIMTYERNMLRIAMAASIKQIAFRYDYAAEIMGLGPTGWLEGNTDQLVIACDFIVDFHDFMIYMQDFRVVSLGNVNINLRGNPLLDWFSSLIINTVTSLFRGPITDFISLRFKEFLQETIDDMNSRGFAASNSHKDIQEALQKLLTLKGFAGPLM